MNLCLTLAEPSLAGLTEKLSRYAGQVPFVEVRLDHLAEPRVPVLPGGTGPAPAPARGGPLQGDGKTQFIATCRPVREGGLYTGLEAERLELLRQAAEAGFHFLDLERDVGPELRLPASTKIIRSYHSFIEFPRDLRSLYKGLKELPGDVTKISVTVSDTDQLVTLLKFAEEMPEKENRIIIGMGTYGQPSRLIGVLLGNFLNYVSEGEESTAAPGQFSLKQATEWYRFGSWSDLPSIYGVLGNPVSHSISPPLHNRLFKHYGLGNVYFPLPLTRTDPWFEYIGSSRLSFGGFSVTLPFKTDVVKYVQHHDSPVPALNTLVKNNSGWAGLNSDYPGFLKPLTSRFDLRRKTAVVLGNGGVAHTVVGALQNQGVKVIVVGRNAQKATDFAARYRCRHALFSDLPIQADICINTTPVGQYPDVDESPLSEPHLRFDLVYDLIYRPAETKLLQMARRKGMTTISGLEMFVEQAALQFLAWTGIDPDRRVMTDTVREFSGR